MGQACVRTTLGTSFRDTAVAGVKGVLVLLDGGLEGGQGLEQLGLGAWEFRFGVGPKTVSTWTPVQNASSFVSSACPLRSFSSMVHP